MQQKIDNFDKILVEIIDFGVSLDKEGNDKIGRK